MIPKGDFVKADFAAINMSVELQGLAMDYIMDAYFAEEKLNINNLTYANFMKEYEAAKDGDELAKSELDRQLLAILQPVIQQVMTPQPQNGNQ